MTVYLLSGSESEQQLIVHTRVGLLAPNLFPIAPSILWLS